MMQTFFKWNGLKVLSVSCALLLFLVWSFGGLERIGGGAFRTETQASEVEWTAWTPIESPASMFWGNRGTWTQSGSWEQGGGGSEPVGDSLYKGLGIGAGSTIYSYTALDAFGDASEAATMMTHYRVKMILMRPLSWDPYAKIVVGAKSAGTIGSTKPLQIDITSTGLVINQFGNTHWNANGGNYIYWNVLIPGGINSEEYFAFEIAVTPEYVEVWINGVSRYKVLYSGNEAVYDEVGLFGLFGMNATAVKGVTFGSIQYSLDEPPAPVVPLSVSFSSAASHHFAVGVAGLSIGDRFQVWALLASRGEGTSPARSWALVKSFLDLSRVTTAGGTSVDADGDGNVDEGVAQDVYGDTGAGAGAGGGGMFFDYVVPQALWTPNACYEVFVRVQDGSGEILLQSKDSVATFTSGSSSGSSSASSSGTSSDSENSGSSSSSISSSSSVSDSDPAVPGVVITDPAIGNRSSMRVGESFALDFTGKVALHGNTPKYKFIIGEPWKPALMSQGYSTRSLFDRIIEAPGVYLLQSFVSHGSRTAYDDGLLQSVTVLRREWESDPGAGRSGLSEGSLFGAARFSSCAVRVDGGPELFPVSSSSSGTASISSPSATTVLDTGDLVSFDAVGAGLTDWIGSAVPASDYQYSFYRLDVNGYREVKAWCADGTLLWRPFAPGYYSIAIRVRGSDAASYEQQIVYRFLVNGVLPVDGLSFTADKNSALNAGIPEPAQARRPVTITATAGGTGSYVYRFEVWDAFMGNITLRGFSPEQSVVWIPRKPGVYRITVRAQDVTSCGFGDQVVTGGDFVVAE